MKRFWRLIWDIMKRLWRFIWDASEFTGIGLGRFAPFVFGGMIGRKGVRVDESQPAQD